MPLAKCIKTIIDNYILCQKTADSVTTYQKENFIPFTLANPRYIYLNTNEASVFYRKRF